MSDKKPLEFAALSEPLQNWLAVQLRGEAAAYPDGVTPAEQQALVHFAAGAGLHPYLWHLHQRGGAHPTALAQVWQMGYVIAQTITRLREAELLRIFTLFQERGIRVLVLKGTAIARLIYPDPALRPAGDMDLLVAPADRQRAAQALLDLGYQRGNRYTFEEDYRLQSDTVLHAVDLHWKVSDSPFLSEAQLFDDLLARALPFDVLPPIARGLGRVDALLNACTHMAKDRQWDHFIWLLDIDLLLRRMSAAEVDEFAQLAIAKNCGTLCAAALERAREILNIPVSEALLQQLTQRREISAYLLNGQRDILTDYCQVFRVSRWATRAGMIWRALFPSANCINPRYKKSNSDSLALIRFRRLLQLPWRVISHFRKNLANA